ncbi:hypothetical protein HNR05_002765 [Leifsonia psychrotolerans]|uniref:Uncharacterized protein n=1 Tax=Glaciibacter psychrotolerans TaxID=670054 RepID=A0A7Z0J7K5_9MICO|nr:hypothetical protein [Leifsonia psychrotolerans]
MANLTPDLPTSFATARARLTPRVSGTAHTSIDPRRRQNQGQPAVY